MRCGSSAGNGRARVDRILRGGSSDRGGRARRQGCSRGQEGQARLAATDCCGIAPGKIKHVWLIILENKSYDATFTGLNNNTYLWKTLPAQGVLLKNYYGTGHFSLDNYISMVSGQATAARHAGRLPLLRPLRRVRSNTHGLAAHATPTTAR